MTENMKKFLEAMSQNAEQAKKISELDKDGLIAAAKTMGIELTEADFVQPEGELNDDELETVAGGGECACVLGGGGTKGENYPACACVGAGVGIDSDGKNFRCICSVGGAGGYSWEHLSGYFTGE